MWWKSPRKESNGSTCLFPRLPALDHGEPPNVTPTTSQLRSSFTLTPREGQPALFPPPPPSSQGQRWSRWKKIQTAQLPCLSFPIPKTHQLSLHDLLRLSEILDNCTRRESWGCSGALPGSLREPCGKRRDCPVSPARPAKAMHQLSGLRTWTCLQASMSSSVYIAETRAGLWGQRELPRGPLG